MPEQRPGNNKTQKKLIGKSAFGASATPMMEQYLTIKKTYPDYLLFYRMGDFYEMFFDDAEIAAEALNITLTKRGKHKNNDVAMCGVPAHASDTYLARLIKKGFRVAICEQLEDPAEAKKRKGSRNLVKRDVVRLVTPGTLTEESLLESNYNNFLAAFGYVAGDCALAWLDISTGEFCLQSIKPLTPGSLGAALARIAPGEILLPEKVQSNEIFSQVWKDWTEKLVPLPDIRFDSTNARKRLETVFGLATMDGAGQFCRAEFAAAGALIDYVELTQVSNMPRLALPRQISDGTFLEIDAATRRNLELTKTLSGDSKGSLLATIDRTVSGSGARLLAARLNAPLTEVEKIRQHHNSVEYFVEKSEVRKQVREALRKCPDFERALSRLTVARCGPRDLASIRSGLAVALELKSILVQEKCRIPLLIKNASKFLGKHGSLIQTLDRALKDELPIYARDGGFLRKGYSKQLDELQQLGGKNRMLIASLEAKYRSSTGAETLKIKKNNVLGYFIEVSARQANRLDEDFIHRQTMANAIRFSSIELVEFARQASEVGQRALNLELRLFNKLINEVTKKSETISCESSALAEIDVASSLAELAWEQQYCKPDVVEENTFSIVEGRHPVVEVALSSSENPRFVSNDCDLNDKQRILLITGPNMAGKSTFLRQNALILVLAQMGSFVPASKAEIGIVDRLFSRVGASDDLARGRSTFMVEMVETASILNQASERSFVILDEIGRGTATFDGLSIAWAAIEYLHDINSCRALFASHYHELVSLETHLDSLKPFTMKVKEWQGKVVFLHEIAAGSADRSYGIHVAKLAGLPLDVISRAEKILSVLESGQKTGVTEQLGGALPLFERIAPTSVPKLFSPADIAIRDANPDEMTPRQALELIYELKKKSIK